MARGGRKAEPSKDINTEPRVADSDKQLQAATPYQRWKMEIELASKAVVPWEARGDKVVKRYRDERDKSESSRRRFALLWSNVQTLGPALYSKPPKVVVSRRFNDSDRVGRVASQILERGVEYELEKYEIGACMRPAVQDRLLPGRGCAWVRYEPKITGTGDAYEKAWECTPTDYVFWKDFLTNTARTWDEVRWGARRTFPSRAQLVKRFGEKIGNAIPLTAKPSVVDEKDPAGKELQRAEVWEIWDRDTETVYWIATGYDQLCDQRPDPLKIEGFFPFPKPMFATMTNGTLIPVPDYAEYQDQAMEIDELTERIASLNKAVKVVGLFDKSIPELQRLVNDGIENRMIGVDSWAAFAEKGGIQGSVTFMPLKDVIEAIVTLTNVRTQVMNDAYQITGMADIVRGASNPNETATAQQIKGKYANLRLSDLQMDVERFARDLIRIKAEIMAEQYSPETLIAISGIMQTPEFVAPPKELQNPPQPPQIPQPQPGQPPDPAAMQQAQQAMQQYQMQQQQYQQALQQWQKGNEDTLKQAIELLKSPKFRDLRIDVETQSMIQMDQDMERQTRTEFIGAVGGFLQQGGNILQVAPQAAEMLGELLRFVVRAFPAGREMESVIDRFTESMQGAGQQGDPKQAQAAQAEKEKLAAGQMDLAKKGMELQGKEQGLEGEKKDVQHQRDLLGKDTTIAQLKIQLEEERLKAAQEKDGLHLKLLGKDAEKAQGTIEQAGEAEQKLTEYQEQLNSQAEKPDLAGMLMETTAKGNESMAAAFEHLAQALSENTQAVKAKRRTTGKMPSGKAFESISEVVG